MDAVCAKVEAANKVSVPLAGGVKNGVKTPRTGEKPSHAAEQGLAGWEQTFPARLSGCCLLSSSSKIPSKLSRFSRNTTGTGECCPSRCHRGRSRCRRRIPGADAVSPPGISRSLNVAIECKRVSGLEPATLEWAFDLTKANMQTL